MGGIIEEFAPTFFRSAQIRWGTLSNDAPSRAARLSATLVDQLQMDRDAIPSETIML